MKLHKDSLKYKGRNENGLLTIPYGITLDRHPTGISLNSDPLLSNRQYMNKVDETISARNSALQDIENAFKNGNIKLEDLGGEYFFLRDNCLCFDNLSPQEEME